MKTVSTDCSFNDIMPSFTAEIQELARRLRSLIEEVHPDSFEVVWPNQKIAGYGVGPKKMTEHFSYIAAQTRHVNLGFMFGAALEDPTGLLAGNGKKLRHVKLHTLAEAESPALRELLKAAVAERWAALN